MHTSIFTVQSLPSRRIHIGVISDTHSSLPHITLQRAALPYCEVHTRHTRNQLITHEAFLPRRSPVSLLTDSLLLLLLLVLFLPLILLLLLLVLLLLLLLLLLLVALLICLLSFLFHGPAVLSFLVMGAAAGGFAVCTYGLFETFSANYKLVASQGLMAVFDGGLLQFLQLAVWGYAGVACYLVFKGCLYGLLERVPAR